MSTKSDDQVEKHAAGLVALAIDGALGGFPVLTLTQKLVQLALFVSKRAGQRRADRAVAELINAWGLVLDLPRSSAERAVEGLLSSGDPANDEAIYETFQHMQDSRSAAAWPYIALLTATYVNRSCSQTFFKRLGWLLEHCEDEDIDLLHRCAVTTQELGRSFGLDRPHLFCEWDPVSENLPEGMQVYCYVTEPTHSTSEKRFVAGSIGRATELCHLITTSRLSPPMNVGFNEIAGEYLLPLLSILSIPTARPSP